MGILKLLPWYEFKLYKVQVHATASSQKIDDKNGTLSKVFAQLSKV